jgi:tripartite-type tricarboxylate transporter receptor subunit TctC
MAGKSLLGRLDRSAFGPDRRRPLNTWVFSALLALGTAASAQDYPSKPIRMVVGFPPGGGTDVVARILAPRMSELLGQPIVIENRPGATGTVAAGQVAKAPPDGYTIMMGHVSVNAIAPSLFSNLPYDVLKDFSPIAIAAAVPHLVTVHPSMPAKNLKELIAHLRGQPGKLTFPSAGNGSMPHLAGEIFKSLAGVQVVHVPYKGTGQSMQDLLGGQHLVAFDTMPASSPHVRSGKLRALAVSSATRVPGLPDVPTAEEAGLAGYVVSTWYGVFAPAGTPPAIVARLHAETVKAMQTPDTKAKLEGIGADGTVSRSPEEFAALVRADTARYAKIVKDIGLKLD